MNHKQGQVACRGFAIGPVNRNGIPKPGEIIVREMTTPDLVMGMKVAAGVVTMLGGILCHAAIVCREFNVPCVVGVGPLAIEEGTEVTVDANRGTVSWNDPTDRIQEA